MDMLSEISRPKLTTEDKVDVIRRHFAGEDMMDLCREFKISAITFHGWRKTHAKEASKPKEKKVEVAVESKKPRPLSRTKPYTKDERAAALNAVGEGFTYMEAAELVGATEQSVRNWHRKAKMALEKTEREPEPEKPKPKIIVQPDLPNDVLVPTAAQRSELSELREENKILREITTNQLVEITKLRKSRSFH